MVVELGRGTVVVVGDVLELLGGALVVVVGARVVVVEDVLTTGRSALEALAAVEGEGGHVLGVLTVVDREEGGRAALEQAGYQVEALVTAQELGLG